MPGQLSRAVKAERAARLGALAEELASEYAERFVAIELLDVATALDIDIEDHVLAGFELLLNLALQGAVEAVLIHFLVFQELAMLNLFLKLGGREEKVFHAVAFLATWRTAGGTDAEC